MPKKIETLKISEKKEFSDKSVLCVQKSVERLHWFINRHSFLLDVLQNSQKLAKRRNICVTIAERADMVFVKEFE